MLQAAEGNITCGENKLLKVPKAYCFLGAFYIWAFSQCGVEL